MTDHTSEDRPAPTPRQAAVLREVVRRHVEGGQPVGSAAVAQAPGLGLGAASIRRVMAELETLGLLEQPHTSAGRVPTDRGYRVYVEQTLSRPTSVPRAQAQEIDRALGAGQAGDLPALLERATRLLSRESHQMGVILAPELRRIEIDRLEFVPVDGRRVVAIVVGRSGLVCQRVLMTEEPIVASELEQSGRFLTAEFRGRTLPQILEALRRRQREDRATFDRLLGISLALCGHAVDAESSESTVFVEGASNLLESPEFADLGRVQALLRAVGEKDRLIHLLDRLLDGGGVQVLIGGADPPAGLDGCAVVVSPYGLEGQNLGAIGVLGPRRMPYPRVIALVEHLAGALTGYLSDPEN